MANNNVVKFFLQGNWEEAFNRLNQIEREILKQVYDPEEESLHYRAVRTGICRKLLGRGSVEFDYNDVGYRERYYFGDLDAAQEKKEFREYRSQLYEATIWEICRRYPYGVWEALSDEEKRQIEAMDKEDRQPDFSEFQTDHDSHSEREGQEKSGEDKDMKREVE